MRFREIAFAERIDVVGDLKMHQRVDIGALGRRQQVADRREPQALAATGENRISRDSAGVVRLKLAAGAEGQGLACGIGHADDAAGQSDRRRQERIVHQRNTAKIHLRHRIGRRQDGGELARCRRREKAQVCGVPRPLRTDQTVGLGELSDRRDVCPAVEQVLTG